MATPIARPGPDDLMSDPGKELDVLWGELCNVVAATEDRSVESAAEIAAHEQSADPHPQYVTAERFEAVARSAGAMYVATPMASITSGLVYLYAHPAQQPGHAQVGQKEVYVPIGVDPTDGVMLYYGSAIGIAGSTARVPSMLELGIHKPATHIPHSAAEKLGTWTTIQATVAAGALTPAGATSSGTPGDTITCMVSGRTVGIGFYSTSNGGFGVVAIDGDYTRATRLPRFSNADFAAGRCRVQDVGRCYYDSYAASNRNASVVIADDLSPGPHAITLQVTGMRRAGAAGARVYVEHFWSSAAVTPGAAGAWMEPVHSISAIPGGSAMTWVASYAPAGSTDFTFLGDVLSDGTFQSAELTTALTWHVAGTDQTALGAGSWSSGAVVSFDHATTLAHKSALTVPVARKRVRITFAPRPWPVMCSVEVEWLANGLIGAEYPIMLPIGGQQEFMPFNTGEIDASAFALTNNNNNAITAYVGSCGKLRASGQRAEVSCAVLRSDPDLAMRSSVIGLMQDRVTPGEEKLYVVAQMGTLPVFAGDTRSYLLGWSAKQK